MKIIKIKSILYSSMLFMFMYACNPDDILDRPKDETSITSEIAFNSVANVNAIFAGIYRAIRSNYRNLNSSTSRNTDVRGLYAIYFARTVKGNDFINSTSHYHRDYENANREPAYRRTNFVWRFCYDMINRMNIIIDGVNKSTELAEADKGTLTAHARALRAFFYFQLAIDYQSTYTEDASKPSLPIYTTPKNIESKPISSLQEVYDLIKEDLQFSVDHLDDSRISKSYIHKKAAQGIYARVLLVTQDNWPLCEQLAHDAYGGTPESVLAPEEYTDGFDKMEDKEWMWAMHQQDDQTNYYSMTPHVMSDHDADGYSSLYVNKNFVDTFSATDIRKLFEDKYHVDTAWRNFVTTKFKFSFTCDAPLMRVPEMILMEAEAKFWQGDIAGAASLLYALQKNRDPNAAASGNTGEDLFNEILLERRKELYGEIGIEFFDLKRLRRPMTRDDNHRTVVNLEKDDKRYYLKIPQREIDANPNITEAVNSGR